MVVSWARRSIRPAPTLVAVLVASLVAALVVVGEPNRPATATIVRPIVTVPALCSVPTVVDVAARDATRGLSAVGQLLGIEEELVADAARDLAVVDTDAGTFFVLARDGLLRVAALSPAGLPIVNTESDAPQTHRAFALPADVDDVAPLVVSGAEGVFVVLGGTDAPVRVLAFTPTTLASSVDLALASDPDAPTIADPVARPGAAVVRDGILWLAGDDGRLVSFDPLAEAGERWQVRADDAVVPLLARGDDTVVGLFEGDGVVEVRAYAADGEPTAAPVPVPLRQVTGVTYADSAVPAFAVVTDDGAALLRPGAGPEGAPTITATPGLQGDLLGLVATPTAAALLTAVGDELRYRILHASGAEAGSFAATADERCVEGAWPDAATSTQPSSAGNLLHLHDPSAPRDCVVDATDPEALAEATARCAAGGPWSVDKGSAPARDFTVELGRALDELEADALERLEPDETTSAIQEELSTSGIEVIETEVDPEAADECAQEEVTSVAPPVLDLAEAVGSRAIRAEWTWSGGACLPGRYVVTVCQVGDQGSACTDSRDVEVAAAPESARSVIEVPATPDRTYRVSVRALKGQVSSAPSGALLVRTPPVTPDPPTAVNAVLRDGTWQLSWSSCLNGGNCDERPDGYVVTVEGCSGDGMGRLTRRFDAGSRGTSFGADGGGFGNADLLGRSVQFRVATTAGERVSEPVAAGGCTTSVRPGRDASAGAFGVSLTGRGRQVTLAPISGGRALTELFGTTGYDDVSARLIRGGTATSARAGVLAGPATFDVARCVPDGWTVELTPRSGGRDLPVHRARLTGAVVACDPTVDSGTSVQIRYTGSTSSGIDLRASVPGLGQDVDNGLIDGVSGRATCALAFGGSDTYTLGGGSISGDDVSLRMPVPAVLDLRGGCEVQVVVAFRAGGSASPSARNVDLGRAAPLVVRLVAERAANQLDRARTGQYRRPTLPILGPEDAVVVRHAGSGVRCNLSGNTVWRFEVLGTRFVSCADDAHQVVFTADDLDDAGRGRIEVRATIRSHGNATATVARTVPVCQLPEGEPQPPCYVEPEPEPCEFDPSIPADDPRCPPPCEDDPSIPADDPACGDDEEPCPGDPSLPIDDPDCPPDDPPDDERAPTRVATRADTPAGREGT